MLDPAPPTPPFSASSAAAPARAPLAHLQAAHVAVAVASGIMLALSFPGVDMGLLAWVALVPFCMLAFRPRRKRSAMALFAAFGAGFYLTLLYWFLWMHPLTWLGFTTAESLGIVSFAWLGASFLLVLQLIAFGFAWGWLSQRWATPGWRHVVALALGWTALEWLTSLGAFGFTWGNLALSQVHFLPVIQVLDLVGSFPLAGVIVAFNGAIAVALARRLANPAGPLPWKPVAAAAVPVVAILLYGAWRLSEPLPPTTFSVEIVQGNIAGGDKFEKGEGAIYRMANKYLGLTAQHAATDLVLWPETAMPAWLRNDPRLMGMLSAAAREHHQVLMTGTLDWEGQQPNLKYFNAVTAYGADGEMLGFDYKRHLVPYGEYVPGRAWMPAFLTHINILSIDFFPGVTPHIFQLPFAKVGAGVCYDGIFPDAMRPAVLAGAEVLTLVTNDAWYKDTTAPRVLNAHAALRAVENRRWILRAANTGISSIIEPTGNIVATTPVFQDATLVGRAAPMHELTPYTRFGDWPSQLAALGFFGFLVRRWLSGRRASA